MGHYRYGAAFLLLRVRLTFRRTPAHLLHCPAHLPVWTSPFHPGYPACCRTNVPLESPAWSFRRASAAESLHSRTVFWGPLLISTTLAFHNKSGERPRSCTLSTPGCATRQQVPTLIVQFSDSSFQKPDYRPQGSHSLFLS